MLLSLSLEQNRSTHNLYGGTEALIIRGQSQAKKRVILFLTVFVISGFFSKFMLLYNEVYIIFTMITYSLADLFLSVAISVDEIKELFEETENQMYTQNATLSTFEFGVYMLQVDAFNYIITIGHTN